MYEVRRIRLEISPTLIHAIGDLAEYLDTVKELEDAIYAEEGQEAEESAQAEEETEAEAASNAPEYKPVVVTLREANRAGNVRRLAALVEAEKWARARKEEILIKSGELDEDAEEVPESLLESIELPEYLKEKHDAMVSASVIIGSLDPEQCENFPMPETVEGWAELQDWMFDPLFDYAIALNSHWVSGLTPKNRAMPG